MITASKEDIQFLKVKLPMVIPGGCSVGHVICDVFSVFINRFLDNRVSGSDKLEKFGQMTCVDESS